MAKFNINQYIYTTMENQTQNQPQLTLDVAFNNIAALYEQARLTPKEHKVMEASLQMILEVVKDKLAAAQGGLAGLVK